MRRLQYGGKTLPMYNERQCAGPWAAGQFNNKGSFMVLRRASIKLLTGLGFCLLLSGSLSAQYYDAPGLGQKPVTQHPQDYKPLGIRAGGFMLHPGIQLAAEYTDNVFYNQRASNSDTIFHLRPYLTAQSTWSRHSLNVRLAADIARYADFSFRDYEDYFLQVGGKLDVRNRSFFSYSADYMNLHEDLNSKDSRQGIEPTRYDMYGLGMGYDHTFNRLSVGGHLSWQRLDCDDAVGFDGDVINNQDRDRDVYDLTLRAGYQFQADKQAFVSYSMYQVDYRDEYDRTGYQRSGDGYTVSAGLAFMVTGKVNGSIAATYSDRSYDDPFLPKTSGWGGTASLQWRATELTTISGSIASTVEETTSLYASGYLRNLYTLRVDHELRRFLQVNGFVAYSDAEYQQIPNAPAFARSSDSSIRAGVGLSWFINRWMFLNASYDWESFDSNVPGDDFEVNRVWLTLGLER